MIESLQRCRVEEKQQALFYRGLAALAEEAGDEELAERLHGLHADEQHHVSRLSARLLELGADLEDLRALRTGHVPLDGWEAEARRREHEELARYEGLLPEVRDAATRALLEEILETERHHATELGGKWTPA